MKVSDKLVMLPANARKRRIELERRMARLREFAETFPGNMIERGDKRRGFITSGVSYLYVKEAFPEASVLKLGMAYPLPEGLIRQFAAEVDEVIVVEELDPFIELRVKAMGLQCRGKDLLPVYGELNSSLLREKVAGEKSVSPQSALDIPMRPPNLCAGCPHRGLFHSLSKLGVFVSGDIGCYTLAFLKPLSAMDSCVCMGASIGNAFGMEKALGADALGKVVAVIGDSTFIHSGITPLIDVVYNRGFTTVVILDNRTTAMTGHQDNPVSGRTITGEPTSMIDLEALCKAVGVRHVYTVNPHELKATEEVLRREASRPEPSVIISRAPCALLPEVRKEKRPPYRVDITKCTGCKSCVRLGCPAIEWVPVSEEEAARLGYRKGQKGHSWIIDVLCSGCAQCFQVCKFKAISVEER